MEFFFGAPEETPLQKYMAAEEKKNRSSKHRLGAAWNGFKKNTSSQLYRGTFWLREATQWWEEKGIIDTATELNMVNGAKNGTDFSKTDSFDIWEAIAKSDPPRYYMESSKESV